MPDLNEENVIRRVAPHDNEAEESVLGSLLVNQEMVAQAAEYITGEDFYNRYYGMIFDAIVEMDRKGSAVDPVTLQSRLREMNVPQEVSSLEFIKHIMTLTPYSGNVVHYSKIISRKSILRKLIRAAEEIENDGYSDNGDVEKVLESAENRIFDILKKNDTGEFVPIDKITMDVLDKIDEASKHPGSLSGLSTGFTELDDKTTGLQKSDLIIIAARPSMGKTAFALNIAQNVAVKQNKAVAIFSLEMSKEQLVERLISMESLVKSDRIRKGFLKDEEMYEIGRAASVIAQSKLILDDTTELTPSVLRSKCRKFKLDHDIQLVVIDYLQMMSGADSGNSANKQQQISDISRALKQIARELQVPVIALSQLSRNTESSGRKDAKPKLSDIRESGAIEQDADVVMFIYRDDYYTKEESKKPGIAEIIIAKQRRGPTDTVELRWLKEYTKFANLDKKYSPEE